MLKEIKFEQPRSFKFNEQNLAKAQEWIKKYPIGKQKSAVMPLLFIAQEQHDNWIPIAAMDYIAELLDMPAMQVYEVATFYTMFNKQPVGKNLIQVCRTTPCMLRGAKDITKACKQKLNIDLGETTQDRQFTLVEVECLGACVAAPVVQVNNDYYENLTVSSVEALIDRLSKNRRNKP
ncbi:NADH-quinone oxidoreductase subunit NuoE [Candidatus Bandiella euplotis]|nr:NADH-quinone oxidoreductase subunit NuoE [Candidatus Bandiella woodruffii]